MKAKSISWIYPYGIFTISVFSEELKYAIKVNKIKILKIYDMVEYKKEKIFTNFVNDLYKYRHNSGLAYKHSVKILLNSLYGRMGLKKSIDKFILIDKSDLPYYNMIFSVKIFFIDDNSKSAYIKVSNKIEHENSFLTSNMYLGFDFSSLEPRCLAHDEFCS